MPRFKALAVATVLCAWLPLAPKVWAADHTDGPAASADPAADLTDDYIWMSPDATKVNLVIDVTKNANTSSKFSDQVLYVFHTSSRPAFGAPVGAVEDVICSFATDQTISCWVGKDDFVTAPASAVQNLAGVKSVNGRFRVFAGLRDDPFFFNQTGFRQTVKMVEQAAPNLQFDGAGCPNVDPNTSAALVNQLRSGMNGAPAPDDFGRLNVLAIAISVDKELMTRGGPIVSAWAGTNRRQ